MGNKKADNTQQLQTQPPKNEAVVGTAVEYAAYVNFGTRRSDANAFLSSAPFIVSQKIKNRITAEQQIAMKKALSESFDKQRKEGVEIITYGNPLKGIELGNQKSLIEACMNITSQAKTAAPNVSGLLENSIMYRVNGEPDGGFNK